MKLRNILKIGVVACLLVLALSLTGYAASITEVSGTDGANAFGATAEAVTEYTPLESNLNVSGAVDTAEANVTIMISAEDTVVYVNQIVADEDGAFVFDFPVVLEGGYTYEVKVNTENSEDASELYFKTEENEPVHYGDINSDGKIVSGDLTLLSRGIVNLKVSDIAAANIAAGIGDINGDGQTISGDLTLLSRYMVNLKISAAATERLSWYTPAN